MATNGIALDSSNEVEAFRARLRKMSDKDLVQYGKDCAFLCSPVETSGSSLCQCGKYNSGKYDRGGGEGIHDRS
jgi:hypothetical protein